jgi:hypothetical protein
MRENKPTPITVYSRLRKSRFAPGIPFLAYLLCDILTTPQRRSLSNQVEERFRNRGDSRQAAFDKLLKVHIKRLSGGVSLLPKPGNGR